MGLCGGSDPAAAQRRQENERQAAIRRGVGNINTQFEGFNDPFYARRKEAYQDFALPELANQFQNTSKQLAYKNANQGLLQSSGARFLNDSLEREMVRQKQGIADMGQQQANQLRQNVENERSTLISQNQSAADPLLASQQAMAQASTLALPSTFAPVSNFLSGWAQNYLSSQVANAYSGGNNNQRTGGSSSSFATTPTVIRG